MIKSIRLINWRSHADTMLEFRKGTNLLVGIMGAGKSSILEAISFALYGTFPALERRKMKLENIVRLSEPEARVALEFEWDGTNYRVERAIERSKKGAGSRAEIFRAGSLIEHGPEAVNSYVQGLLGVDYDLFTRAIYSEQNNIDYFLTLDPRRRKEEIDALLGLDKFEAARASVVAVINRFRSRREALEEQFSREKAAELEEREKKQSKETASLEAALKKASESAAAELAEAARLSAVFDGMKKSRELFEGLSKDEIRLGAQSESLKRELEGKTADEKALSALEEKLGVLLKERSGLDDNLKALEARRSALSREYGSVSERIKAAGEARKKAEATQAELAALLGGKTLEELASALKSARQELLSIESGRKALEGEIISLEDSTRRLSPGLSECPLCLTKLTPEGIGHVKEEKERMAAQKRELLKELSSKAQAMKKDGEALTGRLERGSLLGDRLTSLKSELGAEAGLTERKGALQKELDSSAEGWNQMKLKSDALAKESETLRSQAAEAKALAQKFRESAAIEKGLDAARKSLSDLKFDELAFESLREQAERARIQSARLQSEKSALESQLRMASSMLKMMREELSALRKIGEEARSISLLEEQLSIFKNALLETQTSLRLSLADAINTAMNEIWPMFYPYRNYRALRLGVSEKDYVFEVDDGPGWKSLETVASGGERACAALALRVALAMVLTPKLGWLILDEPTHNLDSEAVGMLASALQMKIPEVVNQTFVITHDEAFMGSEFASSYRLARDKEHNGETKAEPL